MKHFTAPAAFILALAMLALALAACTDSDDYLFNESDKTEITVGAFMTTSFSDSSERVKSMVIVPGDSVIFISAISPSKAIRNQEIFWTLDGKIFASEYTFRSTVYDAGTHKVAFTLVDYFGDTTSDTVTLYASFPPTLDTVNVIPATGSQNIPYTEPVNLVWNAATSSNANDTAWSVNYRVLLQQDLGNIVDTTISTPYFTYYGKLQPLTHYRWVVYAENELEQHAEQTILANFYTAGEQNESALNLHLNIYPMSVTAELYPSDTASSVIRQTFRGLDTSIKPIPSGDYTLVVTIDSCPDYTPKTRHIHLAAGQVATDTLTFADTIPPTVTPIAQSDTLDIADTLRFIVKDGGENFVPSHVHAKLDGEYIWCSTLESYSDTLLVALPIKSSWSTRILSITAADRKKNPKTYQFYLRPNTTLEEETNSSDAKNNGVAP